MFDHPNPTGVLSWGISSTRRCARSLKREVTSSMVKASLKLLMLVWCKAYSMEIIQIAMSKTDPACKEQLCSRYCCTLICMYTHLKDPSLQMKAWTRKLCVGKQTLLPRERQQHIEITLCKTTFIKMLTDIISHLTYGAIKSSLPWSIFGPFWLNRQFRICQTSLCRLRVSPWFHLLCINKRALVTVSSHTTKAFLPLHSKFCSF